jgi:hypothetical protein
MGKSPGMYRYEIIRILSCPVEQLQDHTEEFLKRYDDEERAIDEARAKEKRRETYKQLKKEFEHES